MNEYDKYRDRAHNIKIEHNATHQYDIYAFRYLKINTTNNREINIGKR